MFQRQRGTLLKQPIRKARLGTYPEHFAMLEATRATEACALCKGGGLCLSQFLWTLVHLVSHCPHISYLRFN